MLFFFCSLALFPFILVTYSYFLLFYSSGQVIGRAVVDARVCASPGRDRDIDETRMHPHAASPTSPLSLSPSPGEGPKRGRKRPAAFTQSLEYSLPTKFFCNPASQQKVVHSLEVLC